MQHREKQLSDEKVAFLRQAIHSSHFAVNLYFVDLIIDYNISWYHLCRTPVTNHIVNWSPLMKTSIGIHASAAPVRALISDLSEMRIPDQGNISRFYLPGFAAVNYGCPLNTEYLKLFDHQPNLS